MSNRPVLAFAICSLLLATEPVHAHETLDIASCPIGDDICVEKMYNIKVFQLKTEEYVLRVASEKRLEEEDVLATKHRMSTLWAQYLAGWIMLGLGLCIILAGLVMSWLQMAKGWKDNASLESAFEFGKDGIKFKSPVIGLFVFIASIYFFKLYIEEVYKITNVIERTTGDAATEKPKVPQKAASDKDSAATPVTSGVHIEIF